MRTVGTAAAIGSATGIFGGVIGYFVVGLLVELGTIQGLPAIVLPMTLPFSLAVACTFVGFVLALWRLWKTDARKSTSPR
jgi:hypothetical protein